MPCAVTRIIGRVAKILASRRPRKTASFSMMRTCRAEVFICIALYAIP